MLVLPRMRHGKQKHFLAGGKIESGRPSHSLSQWAKIIVECSTFCAAPTTSLDVANAPSPRSLKFRRGAAQSAARRATLGRQFATHAGSRKTKWTQSPDDSDSASEPPSPRGAAAASAAVARAAADGAAASAAIAGAAADGAAVAAADSNSEGAAAAAAPDGAVADSDSEGAAATSGGTVHRF
jgi:trimeric autotransporter adhesin